MSESEKIINNAVLELKFIQVGVGKAIFRATCTMDGEVVYHIEQNSYAKPKGYLAEIVNITNELSGYSSHKESESRRDNRGKFREFIRSIKQAWVELVSK